MVTIRNACPGDAEALSEIYGYYVRETAVTFEYEAPSPAAFLRRMEEIMRFWPYLVLEDNGRPVGFAYASPFHERAAYAWCCEVTIYLSPNDTRRGYGRLLYGALEEALVEMGILNLYACIGVPEKEDARLTNNSARFHEHVGYRRIGEFRNCGFKFNTWYHMIWMEKICGDHKAPPKALKAYRQTKTFMRYCAE